jgi:hypothetical protein
MTSIRGLSIDNTPIAITDGSYHVSRNLITEESVGIAGEPNIYGGMYTVDGSFSAAYRPQTINTFIENGILGKTGGGVSNTHSYYEMTMGNESDKSWTFGSCALTTCEIDMRPGQHSKCTFNWIGTYKKLVDTTLTTPDYTVEPSLFYNAYINGLKCRSITFKIERPLGAEDHILGSEYSQTLTQIDNLTIGGTLTLGDKEYSMMESVLYTSDEANWNNDDPKNNYTSIGDMTIKFRNPGGTKDLSIIYIDEVHVEKLDLSVSGMQRFEKAVEWRAITTETSGIKFTTA